MEEELNNLAGFGSQSRAFLENTKASTSAIESSRAALPSSISAVDSAQDVLGHGSASSSRVSLGKRLNPFDYRAASKKRNLNARRFLAGLPDRDTLALQPDAPGTSGIHQPTHGNSYAAMAGELEERFGPLVGEFGNTKMNDPKFNTVIANEYERTRLSILAGNTYSGKKPDYNIEIYTKSWYDEAKLSFGRYRKVRIHEILNDREDYDLKLNALTHFLGYFANDLDQLELFKLYFIHNNL